MALIKMWKRLLSRKARQEARRAREMSPGYRRLRRFLRPLPLTVEFLEDRVVPDAMPWHNPATPPALPVFGPEFLAQTQPAPAAPQVFFLATTGAQGVDYHVPVTVEGIDVPAFSAPAGLAGQESAILGAMLHSLATEFTTSGAEFTTIRPASGVYSTIYLGGDGAPFAHWGHYYGLAEQVDTGNRDRSDNAFVFTDAIDTARLTADGYGHLLADIVAHEAGHLLGEEHEHDHHTPADPLAEVAFKPYTHVQTARDTRADLIADGMVTIAGNAYTVHPKIVDAVRDHEAFYYAGTVGPDGFPDLVMGQGTVHPTDNATWLTRILDMAWAAQNDSSFSDTEKSQILAFAYGYLSHSSGDHWAHTLVNEFAEGVFPDIADVVGSVTGEQRELANALRHFLVEGYVGDLTEGFDSNPNRTILPDGDVSDDSTPGIPFNAPIRFIYETLIRPFPNDPSPVLAMEWEGGTLAIQGGNKFVRSEGSFTDEGFVVGHKITTSGFSNAANNGTFFVTAVTATELTVSAALVNESASGDEKIIVKVAFNAPTTISVDAATNAFVRTAGSFKDDGFVPGQRFTVYGFANYHGDYLVQSISADGKTLAVRQDLDAGNETGSGDEQLVVQGSRGKLLNLVFKLRDIIENAALDAGPRGELGTGVGDLIDQIITTGTLPSLSDLNVLYKDYLYNWVDELNEGIRNWGEVGLASTKALFDPQSRRDLQNKEGASDGPDTFDNALRAKTEAGVGILDVLIEELDDPNGDGSTADSFLNKHLLPMFGLPEELGVLRTALQTFSTAVDNLLAPISELFNPIQAGILQVKEFVKDYIKDQIEERFGFSFEAFEFLTKTNSKMDLASIMVGSTVVPVFKPGDHERLDGYLGLPADHHQPFPARLIVDVNAALAAAGLGTQLRAEADGSTLRLVAIGGGVTNFSITAAPTGNQLGFDNGQTSTDVSGTQTLVAARAAPNNGRLDGDVTTSISINGGPAVAVTVTEAATADNETVGNAIVLGGITFTFYGDAEGAPLDSVEFDKAAFAAYANTVTLNKMLLLMEDPSDGPGGNTTTTGAGQLSALFSNGLTTVNGVTVPYDFKLLNLNGAHGGNILTTTLPGVPGTAGRPWLDSIDEDHVWRQDSATTTTALFRVSTNNDGPNRPAVWETPVTAGTYNVYATWQVNVTQTTNNLENSDHPNQHLLPATNATYTVFKNGVSDFTSAKNQRLFADDVENSGLAFELLGTVTFAADGTLRVELSNIADGHVVAGPVLLVPTVGAARRVQADRDPETLASSPASEYSDDGAVWTDLVYDTGTGNNPLWESQRLRPVFRLIFNDWQNGALEFPSLGDTPSPDPSLPSLVHFGTADFALDANDTFTLDGFAAFLLANPTAHATISGHTDTIGDAGDNVTLSQNRAEAVENYLLSKGVPAAQLTVNWFGETQLFVPTGDDVDEPRNRRVELSVVVLATPLPSHATPFGPVVPDNDIEIPIPDSLKNLILDGADGLVSLAETIESAPPLNITLPVIDKSLAELLDLSGNIDSTIRQPIVNYFATDTTPTVNELFDVIEASIGARIDSFDAILEFDVDLRKTFSVENLELSLGLDADAVGLELDGRLDVDAIIGFVDALADDLPKLTLGFDLTPGGSVPLDERIYVRADRAILSADIDATGLDFGARFGFLSAGVVDGEVTLNTDITLNFIDPNTDGKITLAEITGTPLGTLIDIDFAGTLTGNLPIEVSGLPGFIESSIGSVLFGATNVFDPDTYFIEFDGEFDRVFTFNNIDAASLVGLLGQLTFWLDEFRRSDAFANFDLPLVGPALDKVLGVADAFRDKILIDDRDNGLDDSASLLFDLNAALDAAGLGERIRAENTGGRIRLVANDPNITQFSITATPGLGFDASQSSSGSPTDIYESITAPNPAPANGQLANDVILLLSIDGEPAIDVRVFKSVGPPAFDAATAVNITTDQLTIPGHGLQTGDAVTYAAGGGTEVDGLDDGATYFVIKVDDDRLRLATTFANATAATPKAVDLKAAGDGDQHTLRHDHNTDDNTRIGDDVWKLVNADNAPTFSTVQQMVLKLTEIFGLSDLVYSPTDETLTWSLNLAETFGQLNLPLGFSLDELPEFLTLETGGAVSIAADGALNLTLGVYIGNGAMGDPSLTLDGTELLSELNGGIAIATDQRITGTADVRTVYGQLSGNASFTLSVNGASPVTVTVTQTAATNNTTAQNLADDINAALATAGLASQVQAQTVTDTPGQQRVKLVGLTGVTSLVLTTTPSDPTVKDIGFAAQQPATGEPATAELIAAKDLAALRGRLTGDASFTLSLNNVNSGAPIAVTVLATSTATNRFAFDIVSDVQAAIDAIPALKDQIEVSFSDGKLTLTATNGATSFTIASPNTVAINELGLTAATGNSVDFIITVRDGTSHPITLDGLTTLQDVIDAISTQSGGKVTATINDRGVGLILTDNTFDDIPPGTGTFQVQIANNSRAALDLGIVQADAPEDPPEGEEADGVIEGTAIAGLSPLDRFFIQATPVGEPALASVGVDISTPSPITATAKFGFVGLTLAGGGALPSGKALEADLTVRLNEPAGSTDGRVSLAELINSLDDIGSLFDLSLTGLGKAEFALNADPRLAALGITIDPTARIAVDVNLGDVFAATPLFPTLDFTFPDFGDLLRFGNLNFNFQSIIAGLRQLTDFLDQFEAFDFLDQPLPIAGVSIGELIEVADKFATAIDDARANPVGTLQFLEDKLKQAFGLPASSNAINLVLVNDNNGTPGPEDDFDILKFDINLDSAFSESVAMDFDLGLSDTGLPLELGGGANLTAAGSVALALSIGFDISDPTRLFLFDSTGLEGTLALGGDGISFRAAVGPLGVFVNGGMVDLHGNVQPGNKLFDVGFGDLTYVNNRFEIDFGDFGAIFDGFSAQVGGEAHVSLPVFFPTDSIRAGTVLLDAALGYDSGTGDFTSNFDPRAVNAAGDPIPLAQLFAVNPANFSLLDQLLIGVDGMDLFLEGLQDVLDGQIGSFELPLIGDKLAGVADVIGDFRDNFVEGFRQALEQLANPGAAFAAVTGGGADPVSKILFDLLGPGGLNVLLDSDDAGPEVTVADIAFVTNVNVPGIPARDVFFDWDFKLGSTLVDVGAGIGFDIGIPGLGLETTGAINLNIGWELALGFGINFNDGFYFDIADGSELELRVDVTVPGIGIKGTLGFLQVTATEDNPGLAGDPVTHLGATFAIDINNRNDTPTQKDTKLGFTELGRIGIDAKIGADAVVDLAMQLALSSDLVPDAPTNFPSIVADFFLEWRLGNRAAGDYVSIGDLDGGFLSNGLQYVGFDHVGLDLGTYFTNLIGPIVEKVQEVTEPIKPFLDFLTEPIPVISQLAGPTSLLDIAAMSGFVNPGIIKAIEVVDQVIDIAHSLNIPSGGNVILYFDQWLPALVIYDASTAPPDGLPDLTNPNLDLGQLADDLLGDLGAFLPDAIQDALGDVVSEVAASVTKMLPGGSASSGFKLDIIEDPSQVFGMLLGRPADLVTFTMEALEVEAEFSAFFSIFGPLGVSINAEFAAQFGPFKFGYDTFGITQFADSGFRNPLLLFDGLYVSDLDVATNTTDVPELQFDAGLWAAAELNLGIARAGVAGGLFAEIDFDLHDPDRDGKVRVKEIITNVLNEFRYGNPALSPLAMFDITGQLTARLFAFLKIKLGFFKLSKEFNITPPIVLLDFESNFERFPTLATELPNGVLQLNMGKFAGQRIEGNLNDLPEEFYVKQDGAGRVKVWAPSLGVDESEAQEYGVTSRIIALGGEGNDIIDLSQVTDNLEYELEGNAGDDIIRAGSGTGAARILGGAGNDNLSGGGGNDLIFGETGDDIINGGGGLDWLFGDGNPKDTIVGNVITVSVKANDGADTILGGDADDLIFGGGGADIIEGGLGADVLIGDGGKVTVGADRRVVTIRPVSADPGRLELAVEDTSKGNKGAGDTIRGDGGNDHIYGGVGNDDLSGGADNDVIYGEAGRDTISGDDGDDIAFGDFGTFTLINGSLTPVVTVGGEADTIHGGAGNDMLLGGAGDDIINGDAGDDWIWGGTGLDILHGNDGNDHIYGNADPDQLYGGAGADFLEGGGGNDLLLGGTENDLLIAGYGSDILDGESGSDSYQISARGGSVTELTTAYDSGTSLTEIDTLTLIGTAAADTVLLRAMADYYFPTLVKLIGDASKGLTDKIFESNDPDKLAAVLQALEDSYGPHDIPMGLVDELIDLFVTDVGPGVLAKIGLTYEPDSDPESTVPTLAALEARVQEILDSGSRGKLAEIQKAIAEAYGENPIPATMADEITNAWNAVSTGAGGLLSRLETEIDARYQSELEVLGSDTDTGFMALINNGGANVERFNYRNMEGLVVNTLQGDDYVVSDDVIAATTINLGIGDDEVQIGQVFRSERVRDPDGALITGIIPGDDYKTTEITRGWLSNGVSRPTTVNGGDGNDEFTVFRNVAVLNLNGGDGDDLFTVRAFALKGSSDNERARTDMKGDGGADTILYVVNAPVGIDGGDGFDTVRVVGTEFGDDFVVTDSGIFGAGLNVSYVNIEKLIADGAEGDDRYFVLSTGLDVVTEIDGGLGSDTFFVGGNPSRAPIPVISDDFRGHSGIILHSVESTDAAWDGLNVEGRSANIGDNEQDYILVTESGGNTRVVEGGTTDGYGIRLTHAPGAGQVVVINVVPAGISPEDRARQFRDLEFFAPSAADTLDGAPNGAPLGFDPLTGLPILPSLTFTAANWNVPQYIKLRAAEDETSEGTRFTFINHTAQNSSDPDYREAQLLSVKVRMDDDDRDAVLVTPSGTGNTVLEGGFTDSYDVVLTKQPTANVTVALNVLNGQVALSGPGLSFPGGVPTLTFTPANWNTPQTVNLTAVDDAVLEGFHTDYISFTVTSTDVTETVALPGFIQIDGDFDALGVQDVPLDKPTNYVFLPHRPVAGTVSVRVAGVERDASRFSVVGNTLSFLTADGSAEMVVGTVEARYSYLEAGYHGTAVRDTVVDIYDNEAPTVIVEETNGSTDVIEGSAVTDTYRVRLSRAPTQNVIVTADAVATRTTYGRTANFVEQVTVNGLSATALTFTPDNWDQWQIVTVAAIDDDFFDGNDTQVFAPDLQTVNKIRGPLIIEGAAGAGSLSLPAPLMLPNERNILEPDGNVVAFTPGSGGGAMETMTVELDDLQAVIAELQADDSTIDSVQNLVGKTLEMSSGPGTAVVLDPARPQDLFDRFWLITAVDDQGDGTVVLSLQNPTMVDPSQPNVTAPDATSEYAITALSINFFADEREQVDYLFVFDEDSVANDVGALTSSDGVVLDFTAGTTEDTLKVDTAALQAVAALSDLTDLNALVGRELEITVGPGVGRSWTIAAIADGPDAATKFLTLTPLTPGPAPTDRSEFRIEGGDTHGRITGFGMGPNILFSGRPQPGGITYGDIEVVQVGLGSGNDTVRVDYATNAEDHTTKRTGDFYTLTLLDTGAGNDTVIATLTEGDDGAIAISTQAGNDTVSGGLSTAPLVVFGGDGSDTITGGAGADILFGDIGRVDYVNGEGEIITRLGHSVPPNPVNPPVESATATTIFDSDASFSTEYGGLVGLVVQAISPQGRVQFRRIVANTPDTLTIDEPWDNIPTASYFYRVSVLPENQTDGVLRAPLVVWSIDLGVGGADTIQAGGGADYVFGGAGGDTLSGGADPDVIFGDNGRIDLTGQEYADGVVTAEPVVEHIFTTDTVETTGGGDTIRGDGGADILLGGVNNGSPDVIRGDDGADIILGDDGELIYNAAVDPDLATLDIVRTGDVTLGGPDTITGDAGNDLVFAGTGGDWVEGGSEDDTVFGDFAAARLLNNQIDVVESTDLADGGADVIFGNDHNDLLVGGAGGDLIDGGAHADLIFGDAVELSRRTVTTSPRFRTLTGTVMYDANGNPLVTIGENADPAASPAPAWAAYQIVNLYHSATLEAAGGNSFGNDYIAGGGHNDTIFGQLGDDTIQGDSAIAGALSGAPVAAARPGGILAVNPSFEDATDGDDYIEGNGGSDVIFGNLGQDDIIGGSSSLFTLTTQTLRPDGDDIIFGGAGNRIGANDPGDESADGHARDADTILGDNGNIYRLVGTNGASAGAFLSFNHDSYSSLRIIPRVVALLDYTRGGSAADTAGHDLLLGESGDDIIHGMGGKDVLFGNGQDDDLYGEAGADRIYGGTGEDGVMGDDGMITTTRNGLTEPLYGITTVNAEVNISLPGPFTGAWIYITGRLNKVADTIAWELGGHDVIYGGLGDDFLHGGAGNDGISGAEAQAAFYTHGPQPDGDPLGYDPTTRKLAAYDANNPLAKIDGFFLNFDAVDAGGAKSSDGKDRLFGDLGHDWLVGGTENDRLFGGKGDDVHNADDNHDTNGGLNNQPDAVEFADRDFVYGGDGLDVLVANTGGDRMFDWGGEFNSYIVPFSPFGQPTVYRSPTPHIQAFLLALGRESGADQGLTEPNGELGLFTHSDPEWQQNHGGPRDPQAGNTQARRDTQGGPEDDRSTALPLVATPAAAPVTTASQSAATNAVDVVFDNVLVDFDPSDPTRLALFVGGTSAADTIEIRKGSTTGTIKVMINGVNRGQFPTTVGGMSIGRIIAWGHDGNDTITVFADVSALDTVIYGGDGNDTLRGGIGRNVLSGDNGNDTLYGGEGIDLLIGGMGEDNLQGDKGNDILVGAVYLYAEDFDVLDAVLDMWGGPGTYAERVAALRADPRGFNEQTVIDDGVRDVLTGEQGDDWFIALPPDDTDDKKDEYIF